MKDEEFLKKQIKNLNRHLPQGRTSLAELLKEEKPKIEARDGSVHRFKKRELALLSEILPEDQHQKLKLPIILRVSPQLGRGTVKVSGKLEKKVLRKLLNREGEEEDELLIYRPEIRQIRKKLPTTTQYAFMIASRRGGGPGRTR